MADEDDISPEELLGGDPPASKPEPVKRAKKADEPRLHAILSNEEVLQARANARKTLDAERRAAAMEDLEKRETERLRLEEGLTTGIGLMDEIVEFTVDLPRYTDKISVNFGTQPYHHGRTYKVARHIANSLAEAQWRAWRHDEQVDGKSLQQMLEQRRNTMINARTGAIANAPVYHA